MEAELAANTAGGLWIYAEQTRCIADVPVAQTAQLECEKTLCDGGAGVNAGDLLIQCEGNCLGECSGGCSAEEIALCADEVIGQACDGTCEGTCNLSVAAECEGLCEGTCAGTCTESDGPNCIGECFGNCTGDCELQGPGECSGTCSGTCSSETPIGGCSVGEEVRCDGSCEGACLGDCAGTPTVGAALNDCEHAADCQAQAGALGLANLSCTEVTLRHAFEYSGPGGSEAQFNTKMANIVAALEDAEDSFNLVSALLAGEVNGELTFETPPIDAQVILLGLIVEAGVAGDLFDTVPADRLACVIPALTANIQQLSDIAAEGTATVAAQASLVAASRSWFE